MAKEQAEAKLKLVHLLVIIIIAGGGLFVSFGAMKNQTQVNTEAVKDKVPNAVFENHQIEQRRSDDKIHKKLDMIIEKL